MRPTMLFVILFSLGLAPPALASDFAGEWEYQALNSGDTNFKVEQEGKKLTFYRVLHPEFEGKRYKLEHIYRGELEGQVIRGKMFVREEGMADFEYLRGFAGRVVNENKLLMDDLPLKRIGQAAASEPKPELAPDKPRYTKVVINRKSEPESDTAKQAPRIIPKLIPVARRVESAQGKKARQHLADGDAMYGRKEFGHALEAYAKALKEDASKVELLYKLGLCHGILGSRAAKAGDDKSAAAHLHQAVGFWSRALRYDPYNDGAKENIRRAKQKIEKLGG